MARVVFWLFLLAGLISPMVNGDYTVDYETTDDGFDDIDDNDVGEDADTNDDYGDVFDDYFDDEMRVVDVDQDVAIKACVSNSDDLVNKIDSAYDKCFKDFEDWSEFQENNGGNDKDKDGLSDEYEADEACFYKKMGWVVNNEADKEAIKKDFENLNSNNVKNEFVSSIDACSSWNGKFKGRKKRDAEEDSWALSLARERREARKEGRNNKKGAARKEGRNNKNGAARKGGKNKKGTKKGQRNGRRGGKNGNGARKGNGRSSGKNKSGARKGNGRRRGKNTNGARKGRGNGRRNGNNGKNKKKKNNDRKGRNDRNNKNKNRNGKGKGNRKGSKDEDKKENKKSNNGLSKIEKKTIKQLLPESVYNQLWCYELSVEKALEDCIEAKILP